MSKLNPCPICGCSVRVWAKSFSEGTEYIIECDNDFCGLTYGISCGYNRDEIKKAWNSVTASPAEPKRPKGEWIDMSDGGRIKYIWYEKYMCNKCGERGTSAWLFCPNCGADMRPKDGEDE